MGARRFVVGLALGGLLVATALVFTALVDPSGSIALRWPGKPQLCAPGIRIDPWLVAPGLSRRVRAREVLLGSSRVSSQFSRRDVDALLHGPVLNLALPGARLPAIERLFGALAHGGGLRRAWLGVDFGMFLASAPSPRTDHFRSARALDELFVALGKESAKTALDTLFNSQDCGRPRIDPMGFYSPDEWAARVAAADWPALVTASRKGMMAFMLGAARAGQPTNRAHAREQWRTLERIRARAAVSGVRLVLMVTPSHHYYGDAIENAGLSGEFAAWRLELRDFASRAGLLLFDWADYGPVWNADLERCHLDGECPVYDVNHARPGVGRVMLEAMIEAQR